MRDDTHARGDSLQCLAGLMVYDGEQERTKRLVKPNLKHVMKNSVNTSSRRQFLGEIGKGTLAVTVGPMMAAELGLAPPALADETPKALHFGAMEPLVSFMQETEIGKLQPALVQKLREGETLDRLVAAAALANTRTFGGEDYVGFHTLMAMTPALRMSRSLTAERAVVKGLYLVTACRALFYFSGEHINADALVRILSHRDADAHGGLGRGCAGKANGKGKAKTEFGKFHGGSWYG